MINIQFNGEIISIPSNPDDISLDTGLEVYKIWNNNEHSIEYKREILYILTNLELCYKLTEESIDNIFNNLNLFQDKLELEYYPSFKIENSNYGMHKLLDLSVKEYMDLEFYLNLDDPYDNLDKICSILYRPVVNKTNNPKNILFNIIRRVFFKGIKPILYKSYKIEEYNSDVHLKNSDIFRSKFTYSMGISALVGYNKWKEQIIEDFEPLFPKINKEEDPFAEEEEEYLKEHPIGSSFEEQWGFYNILVSLIPDLSERQLWLKKDIKEFFKYLIYTNKRTELNNSINNG